MQSYSVSVKTHHRKGEKLQMGHIIPTFAPRFWKIHKFKNLYFMIIILSLLFGSIAIGCICKNIKALKAFSDKVSITILLLLLTLGLSVGSQDSVTGNLLHLGFIALAIAVACVAGSVLFTYGISRLAERRRK